MLGVLVFDTLPGLFIGIAVSLLLLLYRSSKPNVVELGRVPGTVDQFADRDRHPENEPVAGVAVLRVESGLFFANAEAVRGAVSRHAHQPGVHAVVLDAEAIAFVDVSAVRMLVALADDLDRAGIQLALAHGLGQVRDVLQHGETPETLRLYPTVRDAVAAAAAES
jgi:SulP family sulfate permease